MFKTSSVFRNSKFSCLFKPYRTFNSFNQTVRPFSYLRVKSPLTIPETELKPPAFQLENVPWLISNPKLFVFFQKLISDRMGDKASYRICEFARGNLS